LAALKNSCSGCHHFVISLFHGIVRAFGVKSMPIVANQGQFWAAEVVRLAFTDLS
jgi:hypothetical protein